MQYADIVTSSTGKSLHSADHGLVLYNDPTLTPKIREAVMPLLTSITHFHETAALCLTLLEMKEFGAACRTGRGQHPCRSLESWFQSCSGFSVDGGMHGVWNLDSCLNSATYIPGWPGRSPGRRNVLEWCLPVNSLVCTYLK